MKFFAIVTFLSMVGFLQADPTSEEQKQRADEENILRQVREREQISPIPTAYKQFKKCFIVREATSDVHFNGVAFRFGNPTKKIIYFFGWEPATPNYRVQVYNDTAWKDELVRICGTGLGIRELPPGKSVLLDVRARPVKFRVGVDLLADDKARKKVQAIWSE